MYPQKRSSVNPVPLVLYLILPPPPLSLAAFVFQADAAIMMKNKMNRSLAATAVQISNQLLSDTTFKRIHDRTISIFMHASLGKHEKNARKWGGRYTLRAFISSLFNLLCRLRRLFFIDPPTAGSSPYGHCVMSGKDILDIRSFTEMVSDQTKL